VGLIFVVPLVLCSSSAEFCGRARVSADLVVEDEGKVRVLGRFVED